LSEVPEAIRYLATGHARAKLVITLEYNNKTPHGTKMELYAL